jgi:hypothetical protein
LTARENRMPAPVPEPLALAERIARFFGLA